MAFFYDLQRKEKWERLAEESSRKALDLNPNLAEACFARGRILWGPRYNYPHRQTWDNLTRAIEIDPNLDAAHSMLGTVYWHLGLYQKGLSAYEKALIINPAGRSSAFETGVIYMYLRQFEKAGEIMTRVTAELPKPLVESRICQVLHYLKRDKEALARIKVFLSANADSGGMVSSMEAIILAHHGDRAGAKGKIAEALKGDGLGHFHHAAANIASAYAQLGDVTEAVKWIERAFHEGYPCYPDFADDPNLNPIRKDPLFQSTMAKLKIEWEELVRSFDQ